jgi:hypothetical protein
MVALDDDATQIEDADWLASMREALAGLRADLPEGAQAGDELQSALGDWQSTSSRLADEIEAALDAGDAAALRAAVMQLREASATAFGPGADFSPEPLVGGEESLPVDPVAGDDDDDDQDAVDEGAAAAGEADEGAQGDAASEVEKPATLPRTGSGEPRSLPAALTLLGLALISCGVYLRRMRPVALRIER